jgi:hypothetical protein
MTRHSAPVNRSLRLDLVGSGYHGAAMPDVTSFIHRSSYCTLLLYSLIHISEFFNGTLTIGMPISLISSTQPSSICFKFYTRRLRMTAAYSNGLTVLSLLVRLLPCLEQSPHSMSIPEWPWMLRVAM